MIFTLIFRQLGRNEIVNTLFYYGFNKVIIYYISENFRRFGNKCACCGEGIEPSEVVRKAADFSYHLDCFHCTVCDRRFETGDQFFLLEDKRLVCKEDYEDAKLRGKIPS